MTTFNELGLNTSVLSAISELGFQNPTPIQEQSIPVFLETERDILGLAQTGTGKTAAFGLPILQKIDTQSKTTQALIVCPTRELCNQISRDLVNYSKYLPGVNVVAVYGGASINGQVEQLKRGAQIIVATPGRLMDLMNRNAVKIERIDYVVLDEADEMLNMGFRDDIEEILSATPENKRVCLFSATMPKEVRQIADKYLNDPVEITVGKKNSGNENIVHEYAVVHAKDKYAALKRVLDFTSDHFYGIIFCTTKHETQDISDKLIRDGYNADCLHGDLSQGQREKVMNRFRHHTIKILLATDVAARGIDVSGLTHVIHYHLPDDIENYTHRSGRTARAGKKGVSFTLLNMREAFKLKEIEKLTNIQFQRILIPSAIEVRDKKLKAFMHTIEKTEIEEEIFDEDVMTALEQLDALTKTELVKKMLSLELKRFSNDYLVGPDLNVSQHSAREVEMSAGRGTRLFVSIGSKDGLNAGSLKDFLVHAAGLTNKDIIRVDVKGVYSFVNVEPACVSSIMKTVHGSMFKDRKVRIEASGDQPDGGRSRSSYGGGGGRSKEKRSFGKGSYGNRDAQRGGRSERGGRGGFDAPRKSRRRDY